MKRVLLLGLVITMISSIGSLASNENEAYSNLLPPGHSWDVLGVQTISLPQVGKYTIVGATHDGDQGLMVGQIFVFNNKNQCIWKSPALRAVSILYVNFYSLQTKNAALIVGALNWGGARGTMTDVYIFTIGAGDKAKLVKNMCIGIGYISQTDKCITIEGELLDSRLQLSFENGVYSEKRLPN